MRFVVNEIAANGEVVKDQRIDDVAPTEGFVIIEDGVAEAVSCAAHFLTAFFVFYVILFL